MNRNEISAAVIRTRARDPASASELGRVLGISQPVISRARSALRQEGRVVRVGPPAVHATACPGQSAAGVRAGRCTGSNRTAHH